MQKNILYVIGTPIGNLKDITSRAVEVLREVDFVVAESRERALKLLSHLDIGKPIFTINTFSEANRARTVAEQLSRGKKRSPYNGCGHPCHLRPRRHGSEKVLRSRR